MRFRAMRFDYQSAALVAAVMFLLAAGICRAQEVSPADEPTTVPVRFQSKLGYQVDIWVDGWRVGYPPVEVRLPTGKHFISAGHMDLVPTLHVMEIVQSPGNVQTIILDNVLMDSKNYDTAFNKVLRAFLTFPKNSHVPIIAAVMTSDEKDFDELVEDRVSPENRRHPMIVLARAKWCLRRENLDEAQKLIASVITEAPTLAAAWQLKARLHILQKRYDDALDAGNRAVALEPANPYNFLARGDAYQLLGETYNARLEYERVLELKPGDARALEGLNSAGEKTVQ